MSIQKSDQKPMQKHTENSLNFYEKFGFHELANWMTENLMTAWSDKLEEQVISGLDTKRFGDLSSWLSHLDSLPDIEVDGLEFKNEVSTSSNSLSESDKKKLNSALRGLIPWRKGPYSLCDIEIDSEWRSDWKWDRLLPEIAPLKNRTVLDVGCGNGYHIWRMLGEGAKKVIGVDPSPRFSVQFEMVKKLAGQSQPAHLVPCAMEDIPRPMNAFDTVFSMGVLYHRRSPIDHLYELKDALSKGGQLVLETLVVEGDETTCLVPKERYAKMRNVWFLPSAKMLVLWLTRLGFSDVKIVDVNQTTTEEQRSTDWMKFESLSDFLNPINCDQTIEGHPAPLRAILVATK